MPASSPTASTARWLDEIERRRIEDPQYAWSRLEAQFGSRLKGATPQLRGRAWRLRGHLWRARGEATRALDSYRRAAAWFDRAGEPVEEARCAIGGIDALLYLGRYDEALAWAARARRGMSGRGFAAPRARLANNEANVLQRMGKPGEALKRYLEARRVFARAGQDGALAFIDANRANCFCLQGDLKRARRLYNSALASHRDAGDVPHTAQALYSLAYLDYLEGHYERALLGLERARKDSETLADPVLKLLCHLDMAEVLLRLGAHSEAADHATFAEAEAKRLGMSYEAARSAVFGALARWRSGERIAEAGEMLERSLTTFSREGNDWWCGETLLGMALMASESGRLRGGLALVRAARRAFLHAGADEGAAVASLAEAALVLDTGDLGRVRQILDGLPPRFRSSPRLGSRWLELMGMLAWAEDRSTQARKYFARATRWTEREVARVLDEQWRSTFLGEWGKPHKRLFALELSSGELDRAWSALESGRGLAIQYRRSTPTSGAGKGKREISSSLARWLVHDATRVRSSVLSSVPHAAAPSGSIPAPPTLKKELGVSAAAARVNGNGKPELSRLLAGLPARTAFVDYFEYQGWIGVIAGDGHDRFVQTRLLPVKEASQLIESLLFDLRGALFKRDGGEDDFRWRSNWDRLRALLIDPWLCRLPAGSNLWIVPVGALAAVPWALLIGDTKEERAREVVIAPGLRLASRAAETRRSAGPTGAPLVLAGDITGLPYAEKEVAAIAHVAPDAIIARGEEESREALREFGTSARWLHLVGHGFFHHRDPSQSGLGLDGKWMLAGEIEDSRLGAEFVTLSACQTARSLVLPGEEWFGMPRSTLKAGARAVVAAQWDVEDRATSRLMKRFYQDIGRGLGPPGALGQAQAALRRQGQPPYFWAGFSVLGGVEALSRPTAVQKKRLGGAT